MSTPLNKFIEFYRSESLLRKSLSLFGGFLIHITLGTVYITGNIIIYLSSYLQHHNQDITPSDLSLILPAQVIGSTLSLYFGSHLSSIYSPSFATTLGLFLLVTSVFLTSFLKDFTLIVLVYGLMYGLGAGLTYTTPLIVSWSHFPKHKGRISGIIISGFGFGSCIFSVISTLMINPENMKPTYKFHNEYYFEYEIAQRFPTTLRYLALIYACLGYLGIFLLSKPSQCRDLEICEIDTRECPSVRIALRTKQFWQLFFMAFCSIVPGLFITGSYKTFGKTRINNDDFLMAVGAVGSISNGSFRFFWGILMDYKSFKFTYSTLLAIQTFMVLTLDSIAGVKGLYLIWISGILCCEGGHFVLFSTQFAKMFGRSMGAKVYGAFFYCFGLGAILGYGINESFEGVIGYAGIFFVLGSLSVISLILLAILDEKTQWMFEEPSEKQ